jgi:phosphoribosylaminoimidazole-succinocarboxamide synthase
MIEINLNYPLLMETDIPDFKLLGRGKVRDIYEIGTEKLCLIATDRISTHDRVYKDGIPHKGYGLTQTASYVFWKIADKIPSHFVLSPDPNVMIVCKAEQYPIEVIVRGLLTGSAWKSYQKTGEVCGIKLPKDMVKNQRFDTPIVTPTNKAITGHDEPITHTKAREIVGPVWDEIVKLSIEAYNYGNKLVGERKAMLVDTKFEWGELKKAPILTDEALTHDSSRFVMLGDYEACFKEGIDPNWIDKQFVRDYAESLGFTGEGEPPKLTEEIIRGASERNLMVYQLLSGEDLPLPPEPPSNKRIRKVLTESTFIQFLAGE